MQGCIPCQRPATRWSPVQVQDTCKPVVAGDMQYLFTPSASQSGGPAIGGRLARTRTDAASLSGTYFSWPSQLTAALALELQTCSIHTPSSLVQGSS